MCKISISSQAQIASFAEILVVVIYGFLSTLKQSEFFNFITFKKHSGDGKGLSRRFYALSMSNSEPQLCAVFFVHSVKGDRVHKSYRLHVSSSWYTNTLTSSIGTSKYICLAFTFARLRPPSVYTWRKELKV